MRLKDIKEGVEYAAVVYFEKVHRRIEEENRLESYEWDRSWNGIGRCRVEEVGVQVGGYARPGVRVVWLDKQTGEPAEEGTCGEQELRALNVLLPWQDWADRYHNYVEETVERERQHAEDLARRKCEERERSARDWMTRTFNAAKGDIAQVRAVLGRPGTPSDAEVRALVEMRYPEGNPYLKDEDE